MRAVSGHGRGAGNDLVDDLTMEQGRDLTELDDRQRWPVAVIGPEVSEARVGHPDPIGRRIRADQQELEVAGPTQAQGRDYGGRLRGVCTVADPL